MALKVAYEGITLVEGAEGRATPAGLFVALGAPMPVGTRLRLEREGGATPWTQMARVARVQEGGEPGVFLVGEGGGELVFEADAARPAVEAAVAIEADDPPAAEPSASVAAPVETAAATPVEARPETETPPSVAAAPEPVDAPVASDPVARESSNPDGVAPLVLEAEADGDDDGREISSNGVSSDGTKNGEADKNKNRRRRRKTRS